MSKTKKIFIGIATIFSTISFVAYIVIMEVLAPNFEKSGLPFIVLTLFNFFVIFYMFICVGGYCSFVMNSELIEPKNKKKWIIGIILFNIAIMPIFWWLYIWNDRTIER